MRTILILTFTCSAVAGTRPFTIEDGMMAHRVSAVRFAPDGKTICFTASEWDRKNNRHDLRLADSETMRWKRPDGWEIEGLLIKPVGYVAGKRYPLILQIHGGPWTSLTAEFDPMQHVLASHGYAILLPNPRGSTGYGIQFARATSVISEARICRTIFAGVDAAIAKGIADPSRLAVMGEGYGGFMTLRAITVSNRFRAAIAHASVSDWTSFVESNSTITGMGVFGLGGLPWQIPEKYRDASPAAGVANVKTPLLLTHGEQDPKVPIAQTEQFYRALKMRGGDVKFIRYPREGHAMTEPNHLIDVSRRQLEWLDQHLR
jgi:dipeptidyl aminopeptidase/acylaminoacyl peptidase